MGGQGGHVPPQNLGYQLTLFGPRGADYARHITTGPPIFLDDAAFTSVRVRIMLFHFLMLLAGGDFIKSLPEIGNLSYLDNDLAPLPGIEKN